MTDRIFIVDRARAVSEVLDGEAIVINMETGCYYSLAGTAAAVWSLLDAGGSAATLSRALAPSHDVAEATILADVAALLRDLETEGLIRATGGSTAVITEAAAATLAAAPAGAKLAWITPRLERFTDMKDFLLVDPIHEVGEKGWPQVR
ncbi:MAG: PqqD family protein [Planctomycetota bacterium]